MADEKQRPTLQDLSKQLFTLCGDFEELDSSLQEEEELAKTERKSAEELLAMVAELLCKVNNVSKTATATQHPVIFEGSDYPFEKIWPVKLLLVDASVFLEEVLSRMIEAKKKAKKHLLEGVKPLPKDFKSPLQCAIDGYCLCECSEHPEDFQCIEGYIMPIMEAANQLAGIFLREEKLGDTELKRRQNISLTIEDRESPKAFDTDIPAERKSAPLSLSRMADYWGGEMTPKKLRAMIDNKKLPVIQINRQTFIFDTLYLPAEAINKVKR